MIYGFTFCEFTMIHFTILFENYNKNLVCEKKHWTAFLCFSFRTNNYNNTFCRCYGFHLHIGSSHCQTVSIKIMLKVVNPPLKSNQIRYNLSRCTPVHNRVLIEIKIHWNVFLHLMSVLLIWTKTHYGHKDSRMTLNEPKSLKNK